MAYSGPGVAAGIGAAAAPATGGLSALLIPLLMSFGPSILGKLFGDKNQKLRQQIEQMLTPQYISNLTNQNYNAAVNSPAYSGAQGTIAAGANQTANQVAQNLAQMGITNTGTGAVLSGLTPSLVGHQTAQLRTTAYQGAHDQALDTIRQRIAQFGGPAYQSPSMAQNLFSGGLEAFQPYLQAWLKNRYPAFAGIGTPTTQAQGTTVGG